MTDASRAARLHGLRRLLRPRHIAFVGGTQLEDCIATCRAAGFDGPMWAVNPRRDRIAGLPCVPAVAALPAAPDAVMLALSPERCVDTLRDLAAHGAGGAVCIAAGFAEIGEDGAALQAVLAAAAGDTALLGPNCLGVLNLFDGAAVWGTGNHTRRCGARGAAIVSQSGAFLYGITNVELDLPLGYAVSTGNQAVVDTADCVEVLADDPRVAVIGLYVEGIRDGARLGAACRKAIRAGIPVIALKGGDTPAGAAVAITHTGAMVVERHLWEAFARRYGLVEVSSPKALVETLKFITLSGLPAGNRLAALSYSGALNGLLAARAAGLGLTLPAPPPAGAEQLRASLPRTVPIANPLDLNLPWRAVGGVSMLDEDAIAGAMTALAGGAADMLVLFVDLPRAHPAGLEASWLHGVAAVTHARDRLGLPCAVAGILPEGLSMPVRERLAAAGLAPLAGFEDAMQALAAATAAASAVRAGDGGAPAGLLGAGHMPHGARALDEAASKARLRAHGLATPAHWHGASAAAARASARLRFPVALKVCSAGIVHKARVGGVQLGIGGPADVSAALDAMRRRLRASGIAEPLDRVLVEEMVDAPRGEFIIGVKRHPGLGLAMVLGHGGSEVESLGGLVTVLLPLGDDALAAALAAIGVPAGSPGHDGLRAAAEAIASYAAADVAGLAALDVNPVIVTAADEAVAADAVIVTAS